jgi:hypothetical protein
MSETEGTLQLMPSGRWAVCREGRDARRDHERRAVPRRVSW